MKYMGSILVPVPLDEIFTNGIARGWDFTLISDERLVVSDCTAV